MSFGDAKYGADEAIRVKLYAYVRTPTRLVTAFGTLAA